MADPIRISEELKQGTNVNYKRLDKRIQDAIMMFFFPTEYSKYKKIQETDGVIEAYYTVGDNADGTDWDYDTFTQDEWIAKCGFNSREELVRMLNFL